MALKAVGVRPDAGGLQFNVTGQHLRGMYRVVGLAQAAGQHGFSRTDNFTGQHLPDFLHEDFKGPSQLVFRLAGSQSSRLGRHGVGKLPQRGEYRFFFALGHELLPLLWVQQKTHKV